MLPSYEGVSGPIYSRHSLNVGFVSHHSFKMIFVKLGCCLFAVEMRRLSAWLERLFLTSHSFYYSRSEECLQSSTHHCLQPASSPEAGNGPKTFGPLQLSVHQLQHLPSINQRPAASDSNFILHAWFFFQLHRFSHLLLR